ncbi:MAG: DUF5666 domain-containing protein [Myxococcales bacterium]|nr:DUF5666 domain-containing protein [Myxococcales bacterium]
MRSVSKLRTLGAALCLGVGLQVFPGASSAQDEPCHVDTPWIEVAGGLAPDGGVGGTGRSPHDGIGGTGRGTPHDGVGGTGRGTPHEGVGGTGRGTPHEGVGGTGRSGGVGGTGIYGTITGFGSICVNGERVHYDDDVPVERGEDHRTASDLAIGQRVWVVAQEEEGELRAESIEIVPAVQGRVGEWDAAVERFQVDGRWIWLTDETTLVDSAGRPIEREALEGQVVTAFGLDDPAGDLIATRVELFGAGAYESLSPRKHEDPFAQRPDLSTVSVEGYVLDRAEGRVKVGPVWVALPDGGIELKDGARLWLRGSITRERLIRPERLQVRPSRPARVRPDVALRPARESPAKVAVARPTTRSPRQDRVTAAGRPNRAQRADRPQSADAVDVPRSAQPTRPERVERPTRAEMRPARDAHRVSAAKRARAARKAAKAARRAAKREAKRAARR